MFSNILCGLALAAVAALAVEDPDLMVASLILACIGMALASQWRRA